MRTTIAFLALSLCAAAQTLVGLPQYGVELSGTVDNPVIINHSGKDIYETTVVLYAANGDRNGVSTENFYFNSLADVVHPGQTAEIHGGQPKPTDVVTIIYDTPKGMTPAPMTVKIVLDSVVFGDGVFVGPDTVKSFSQTVDEFSIANSTAVRSWDELKLLTKLTPGSLDDMVKYRVASLLIGTRESEGPDAAQRLIDGFLSLPRITRGK